MPYFRAQVVKQKSLPGVEIPEQLYETPLGYALTPLNLQPENPFGGIAHSIT